MLKEEAIKVSGLMKSREADAARLESTVSSLEIKCSRLREYIKKLTSKCEDWETSYERQAKVVEKLEGKNMKIRAWASGIQRKYKQLAGDVNRRRKVGLLKLFFFSQRHISKILSCM